VNSKVQIQSKFASTSSVKSNNFIAVYSVFCIVVSTLFLALAAAPVFADFSVNLSVQNSTFAAAPSINVSVWTLQMGPGTSAQAVGYGYTDASGTVNISVIVPTEPQLYTGPFQLKMTGYDENNNAIWTAPPIPPFPAEVITNFLEGQTLYLVPASTVYIVATNESAGEPTMYMANFSGGITDDKFGSSFDSFWPPTQTTNRTVVLAKGRNYTLTIMKMWDDQTNLGVPPLTATIYDTNLSENSVFSIVVNILTSEKYVTGNVTTADQNPDVVITDIFLYPAGSGMIPGNMPPMQIMSNPDDFKGTLGYNITYPVLNSTETNTTEYNLTMIGSSNGLNYVVGIFGRNGTANDPNAQYYGIWQNFTASNDTQFDFDLQPLSGGYAAGGTAIPLNTTFINIILIHNQSGTMTGITQGGGAGILTIKNHDRSGGKITLQVMAQPDSEGSFKFPILQGSNATFQMFNKQFAPKELIINTSATNGLNEFELKSFDMRQPGADGQSGAEITGETFMAFYSYNAACNVQIPNAEACQLFNFTHNPDGGQQARFNPLRFMMGEKVNMMIVPPSGPSVYMIDVDLMASGPPDFNPPSGAEAEGMQGTRFSQLWKLGSTVPKMVFSYAYVGLPYQANQLSTSAINITLEKLYDSNYNTLWNIGDYATSDSAMDALPEDFQDFLPSYACYFNVSEPCQCSVTDTSGLCYINESNKRIYLNILHFSGDSPNVTGDGTGGPNLTTQSPLQGGNYTSNLTITFNYDYSYDKCWLTHYTGVNESLTDCTVMNGTTILVEPDAAVYNITIGYNDTQDNHNETTIFFGVDTVHPNLTVDGPNATNFTTYTSSNVSVLVTVSEGLPSCWYNLDLAATNTSFDCSLGSYMDALTDGNHSVIISVNDSAGNTNSSTVPFGVDATAPVLNSYTPDWLNYTMNVSVSFNFTDLNTISFCGYHLYNLTSGAIDTQWSDPVDFYTENCTGIVTGSYTDLEDGPYGIYIYATDEHSNTNDTANPRVNFTVDTVIPGAGVSAPTAINYSSTSVTLTMSPTDSGTGVEKCWYALNGGAATNVADCAGATLTAIEGANTVLVYVNDTAGNINYTNITFEVDLITDVPSVSSPIEGGWYNSANITLTFNYHATYDRCWAILPNGTNDTSTDCTVLNGTTILGDADGLNNLTIGYNDTLGNINTTIVWFTVDLTVPAIAAGLPNMSESNVASTANITFNLTEAYLNASSISVTNYVLTENLTSEIWNVSLGYSSSGSEWYFSLDPYLMLRYDTTYWVNLSGLQDNATNVLAENYVFYFTTMTNPAVQVAQVLGNGTLIDTNLAFVNVTVNGTDDFVSQNATNAIFEVLFVNPSDASTVLEFNYTFNDSNILTLSNVTVQVNPDATKGSILIHNLDLSGATKTLYLDNITYMTGICVADTEVYDDINDFSSDCTGSVEVWVACPGTNGTYACEYVDASNKFKISGLSNSVVVQANDTIAPTVLSKSSPSSTVTVSTATLTVTTDTNATCKYDTSSGIAYASMSGTASSLGTTHSWSLTGLTTGTAAYYVRCTDAYSNVATTDYDASFTVSIASTSTTTSSSSGTGSSQGTITAGKNLAWSNVAAGTTITKIVGGDDFPVATISFATKTDKTNVGLLFNKLSSAPSGVTSPSGKTYAYLQVTPTNLGTNDLTSGATFNVRVLKTWLSNNGIAMSDVVVKRWVDSAWVELPTTKASEDATYYYFDAKTPGFSYFAIGQKTGSVATPTIPTVATTPKPTATISEPTPTATTPSTPAETSTPATTTEQAASEPQKLDTAKTAGKPTGKGNILWWVLGGIVIVALVIYFVVKGGKGDEGKKKGHEHHHGLDELKK